MKKYTKERDDRRWCIFFFVGNVHDVNKRNSSKARRLCVQQALSFQVVRAQIVVVCRRMGKQCKIRTVQMRMPISTMVHGCHSAALTDQTAGDQRTRLYDKLRREKCRNVRRIGVQSHDYVTNLYCTRDRHVGNPLSAALPC